MQLPASATQTPDWVGLIAAILTGVIHLILGGDKPNGMFIVAVSVFWIGFIIVRVRQDRCVFRKWGFRSDNLRQALPIPAAFLAFSVVAMVVFAYFNDSLVFPATTIVLLLLYPLWGLTQQFLVLGIVVSSLESLEPLGKRPILLLPVGATVFGMVHLPNVILTAGTFGLGLVLVPLYLKYRNLWPLGFLHGWLGTLFYLWVLGRDPWLEAFG